MSGFARCREIRCLARGCLEARVSETAHPASRDYEPLAVFGEVGNEFGFGALFLRFEAGIFFILEVERDFENKRAYGDVNLDIFARGALPV